MVILMSRQGQISSKQLKISCFCFKGDLKGGGGVKKPSNPYVIPVTSRGCFGVGLC